MRKPSSRKIAVPAAIVAPAAKPVPASKRVINTAPLGTAANAQAARSNVVKPVAPVAAPTAKAATPVAVAVDRSAARLASREIRNADYARDAAYPFNKLSPADRAYFTLFAAAAKSNGGTFSTAVLDVAGTKPAGVTITNNRARAHRLAQAGFLTQPAADKPVFAFVASICKPDKAEKRPDMLAAISAYNAAK